LWQSHGH
jgi:hypothetical protein